MEDELSYGHHDYNGKITVFLIFFHFRLLCEGREELHLLISFIFYLLLVDRIYFLRFFLFGRQRERKREERGWREGEGGEREIIIMIWAMPD